MAVLKLKDIAAATGVHEMTVSRALRNVGRMRPETRQRVLEVASQMGYRPNAAAAAMRTGRTGCIAMISSSRHQAAHLTQDTMATIVDTVAQNGGYLAHVTISGQADDANATALPRLLHCHLAEGLLLNYLHDGNQQLENFLAHNDLPAVWLNHKRRINAVYPDDFCAARKVTEQLIALGHRRIAFVRLARTSDTPCDAEHYSVADRVAGYEAAMQQSGWLPEVLVFNGGWDQWNQPIESRLHSLAQVFSDPARRPTAVILHRDGPVMLELLQKINVRVPEEVTLVAFSSIAKHTAEQMLSWVPVPVDDVGRKATEMLFQMIETGQKEVSAISLPYGNIAAMHTVRPVG